MNFKSTEVLTIIEVVSTCVEKTPSFFMNRFSTHQKQPIPINAVSYCAGKGPYRGVPFTKCVAFCEGAWGIALFRPGMQSASANSPPTRRNIFTCSLDFEPYWPIQHSKTKNCFIVFVVQQELVVDGGGRSNLLVFLWYQFFLLGTTMEHPQMLLLNLSDILNIIYYQDYLVSCRVHLCTSI